VPVPPRRIVLVGVTGSGKSVLAARIAEQLGAPYVAMDELYWAPGWVEVPEDERAARYATLAEGERWVADALPRAGRGALLSRADVVLALDYPRWLSLQRLLRRTARRLVTREPICNGNTETLHKVLGRDSIIAWHFRSFTAKHQQIAALAGDPGGPSVVRLTSPSATDAWLQDLRRSLS
jgi:adenylate kinase family enzyme